ncbi:MAG TPA: glycosyltransferase family 9 protein [Ktedonobacterales bacterium]
MDASPRGQPRSQPAPTPQRILMLALLPIGDTLFLTPTIRALRARYPAAHLAALAFAAGAPVLDATPELDAVIRWPRGASLGALAGRLAGLRALRRMGFDTSVDCTSPWYKWISLAAGIPRRTYLKFDRLWWLLPASHTAWRATHATRLYYDCARELDLPPWDVVDQVPTLALPPEARAAAEAFVRENAPDGARARPLIAIHPGGTGLAGHKRWPAERFAAVADALAARHDARVVLLGGPDEMALADAVAARMRAAPLLAAGKLPLLATGALIARCALFVGNDSSLLHLAAALGTSYVGIFGPTSPANFRPIPSRSGQGRLVLPDPPCARLEYFVGGRPIWQTMRGADASACLAGISVARVLAAADAAMEGGRMVAGQGQPTDL